MLDCPYDRGRARSFLPHDIFHQGNQDYLEILAERLEEKKGTS